MDYNTFKAQKSMKKSSSDAVTSKLLKGGL
nr:MAG TPA: hypothetical protein [Caudoviricetes sp.]